MAVEFVIAQPRRGIIAAVLIRLPLGPNGVALKVRETWPRTNKVYCHRVDDWPDDLEVIERVPVRSCVRRGSAVDLVLDRAREHRSQFVFTRARGREMIFWQSARTAKQARPAVSLPTARAAGQVLEILVDSHERYAWKFEQQQATTVRRALPAGDYAVNVDGEIIAAVERKSLADLVSTLTTAKLRYALAHLAAVPGLRWSWRIIGRRCSSSTAFDRPSLPTGSPKPRYVSLRCRSCSARRASSPRVDLPGRVLALVTPKPANRNERSTGSRTPVTVPSGDQTHGQG